MHTSANYFALRLHELSQWSTEFSHAPFTNRFRPTHSLPSFISLYSSLSPSARLPSLTLSLTGRITAKRTLSPHLTFLVLTSSSTSLQVMCTRSAWTPAPGDDDGWGLLRLLRIGDVVGVTGYPGKTKSGELSLIPRAITPLVPCMHELPLASSGAALGDSAQAVEGRFRARAVDMLVHPASVRALRVRAQVLATVRGYLTARGFLEVDTPILWPSAGGANARPFTTHSHALSLPLHLRVAPELFLKQLVIGGVDRVFEVGRVFRNEGVDGVHNPEFTTVEVYEAYGDYEGMIRMTEEVLREVVREVKKARGEDGTDLTVTLPAGEGEQGGGEVIDFAPPFRRVDILPTLSAMMRAELPDPNAVASIPAYLDLFASRDVPLPPPPHTLPRLLDRLISHYLEPLCTQPTFLLHHPISLSPLAHSPSSSSSITERWELFIGGREYINAYSELNDWREQGRRMRAGEEERRGGDDEAQGVDEEYLKAMEYGLPPTGGWGMGVDRLVMLLTGATHIRDVIFFPIMKKDQAQPSHPPSHPQGPPAAEGSTSARGA